VADGEEGDAVVAGDGGEAGEEGGLEVGAAIDAGVEQQVDGVEDDEAGMVVGADGLLKLVGMGGKAEGEEVLRKRRADAVENGDAEQIGAGGGEAGGEDGVVLRGGEEDAGGGDFAGAEAADEGEGAVDVVVGRVGGQGRQGGGGGAFGGRVVGPGEGEGISV
jgi:hypothetical protein